MTILERREYAWEMCQFYICSWTFRGREEARGQTSPSIIISPLFFFLSLSLIYSFKTSKLAVSVSFRSDDDDDDQTREGR